MLSVLSGYAKNWASNLRQFKWVGGIKYKMNVGWASAVSSAERLKHETQRLLMLRYR